MEDTCTAVKEEIKIEEPKMWKVIFHNDNETPMGLVVDILVDIFKHDSEKAVAIMLEIHHTGAAPVGVYPKSIAETKQHQAIDRSKKSGFNLKVTVEKE